MKNLDDLINAAKIQELIKREDPQEKIMNTKDSSKDDDDFFDEEEEVKPAKASETSATEA